MLPLTQMVKRKSIILLVDDDADLRGMYRVALTIGGFAVREAADGLEALMLLDREGADLVVLDLRMPRLDGFDVLADLRARKERVPVVVVTAAPGDHSDLGVECVLKKPTDPETLVETVQRCLEEHV